MTVPLRKECLGRRVAGVQDLCPALARGGGGGDEGAAEGGGHAAEHRAPLVGFPRLPEHGKTWTQN